MSRVFVNGEPGALLNPLDRGLQYGDGLFETIAIVGGRPRFLEWHLERLAEGAHRLAFPPLDLAGLRAEVAGATNESRAVVKLVLTRGIGERGYRPPPGAEPTRVVAAFPWPARSTSATGARLGWCRTRLGRNRALAGLKHLNRLEQVLARAEWEDDAMDEGLMQDGCGLVIGATQANLFARVDGAWATPRLDECGVAGVMRRAFREWLAARAEPAVERAIGEAELARAEALVLTNALIGAWPVRELAGRALAIDPSAAEFNAWLARQ
jgi:4-amino-4-deoxychorismate lyase